MRAQMVNSEFSNHAAWSMIEAQREETSKIEAAKRKQASIDDALESVPPRFRNKTFTDFNVDYPAQIEVKAIITNYAGTFLDRLAEGSSLIFLGKTGTGKTLLGLILYQYLAQKGIQVEYQPSINFLRSIKEKEFDSYQLFAGVLTHYRELPFLIIDEVTEGCGKGAYPADWERHLLRILIDARYQANRCTLIISNRSKNELIERLGEPTIDRLSENGITLAFNWNSYRQK